ncbi:hypothetical protein [Moraxella ovis]|uniref:hypothetical protein n=1 Tax=Moraxella ovis TaxID=29433 RepID=UPI000DD89633|nr:hypothetical protein [Moraxella ovis]
MSNTMTHLPIRHAAICLLTALAMTTAHATTLQTTLEQGDGGAKLVVVQKDEQGRTLDMPPPQLGISPPSLDLMARTRTDASVTFYNYSTEPKQMELSLIDADDDGVIDSSADTLKSWTVVAPQSFEIPGGGHQTIRLSFRLPNDFPKKTHRAFLMITQKIDKPIVEQTDAVTVVKIGSQYQLPIKVTVQ